MTKSETVLQADFQSHPSGADRHFASLSSTAKDETPEKGRHSCQDFWLEQWDVFGRTTIPWSLSLKSRRL